MKHHPLAYRVTEAIVGLSIALLKRRFPDLSIFSNRVGWTKADFEAWVQNPQDVLVSEAATFLLLAAGVPDDQNTGPALHSMEEQSEVGRDFLAEAVLTADEVREAGLAGSFAKDSIIRDAPPAIDSPDTKILVQHFLDFTGQLEKLFIKLGLVTLEQVEASHRATEESVRLS